MLACDLPLRSQIPPAIDLDLAATPRDYVEKGRFNSTPILVIVDITCGCSPRSWRKVPAMLRIPSRKLAMAAFLALQVIATPCIPCPCGQEEKDKSRRQQTFVSSNVAVDNAKARCSNCKATARIQQSYRSRPGDQQLRLPAITVHFSVVPGGNTVSYDVAVLWNHSLPRSSIRGSRVLLE
jgi:hypothetical protein